MFSLLEMFSKPLVLVKLLTLQSQQEFPFPVTCCISLPYITSLDLLFYIEVYIEFLEASGILLISFCIFRMNTGSGTQECPAYFLVHVRLTLLFNETEYYPSPRSPGY